MAENSKIQWTHATFNPWRGCTRVHAGCVNCYAEKGSGRNPKVLGTWGPQGTRVGAADQAWRDVLRWNLKAAAGECPDCNGGRKIETHESGYGYKHCETCDGRLNIGPHRRRVFCASYADVFEDWQGPMLTSSGATLRIGWRGEMTADQGAARPATMDDVRKRLFTLIDSTPQLDWLLLTKRPENVVQMWPSRSCANCKGYGCDECRRNNVWVGTSASDQATANEWWYRLAGVPKKLFPIKFLSLEPLLGPIDCEEMWRNGPLPEWVIVGGESGDGARPCNIDWTRTIVLQCERFKVPCFDKQLGSEPRPGAKPSDVCVRSLKDKKGGDMSEWPADLRVREFPRLKALPQVCGRCDGSGIDVETLEGLCNLCGGKGVIT